MTRDKVEAAFEVARDRFAIFSLLLLVVSGCERIWGFDRGSPEVAPRSSGGAPVAGGEGGVSEAGDGVGAGGAGTQAASGTSGTSGTSGSMGTSGTSGTSGSMGTSGTSDTSGSTGTSGGIAAMGGQITDPGPANATGGSVHDSGTTSGGASSSAGAPATVETGKCAEDMDCTSPDPLNCSPWCRRVEAPGTCGVVPRDADGDEHGSAACEQNPGDDCDDTRASVYGGAPERCDRLDNDCDGPLDLSDGLPVSGSDQLLAMRDNPDPPSIAFSEGAAIFGTLWREGAEGEGLAVFSWMGPGDSAPSEPVVVNEQPGVKSVALAARESTFAAAWIDSASQVQIRLIAADGSFNRDPLQVTDGTSESDNLAIASIAVGWAVFWFEVPGGMRGRAVSITGELGGIVAIDSSPAGGGATAASFGQKILLTWPITTQGNGAALLDDSLLGDSIAGLAGSVIVTAAGAAGFGVAAKLRDKAVFTSLNAEGVRVCGPVDLPIDKDVQGIAPSPGGFAIIAGKGGVELVEVRADCTILQHAMVTSLPAGGRGFTYPKIASAGDQGFGLVWREPQSGLLRRRFFGPAFCD